VTEIMVGLNFGSYNVKFIKNQFFNGMSRTYATPNFLSFSALSLDLKGVKKSSILLYFRKYNYRLIDLLPRLCQSHNRHEILANINDPITLEPNGL